MASQYIMTNMLIWSVETKKNARSKKTSSFTRLIL